MYIYIYISSCLLGLTQSIGRSLVRVTGIFQWLNPSGRIVALGSTQPLTGMSTRNPSCG
jgi:hypothetical protein